MTVQRDAARHRTRKERFTTLKGTSRSMSMTLKEVCTTSRAGYIRVLTARAFTRDA